MVVARQGNFYRGEIDMLGASSGREIITIDFSVKPVYDSHGEITHLLVEGRNITGRVTLEAAH